MPDEEKKPGEPGTEEKKEVEEKELDPAKIIADLKANTVSKEEYKQLKDKYNNTLKALAEGQTVEIEKEHSLTEEERSKKIKELRKTLFTDEVQSLNNLDYWKKTLELRKHLIDSGKPDPFVGKSKDPKNDSFDQTKVIDMAVDVIEQCIEQSNDNSEVFTALLQSRMEDDPALAMKLAQKKSKELKNSLGRR